MRPWIRWCCFVGWIGVIFAIAPAANQIQEWIEDHLGKRALVVLLTLLLGAAAIGLAVWLQRSQARKMARRLAWTLGLLGLALAMMWRLDVAAEPAHILTYGTLAGFAFWALSATYRDHGVYFAAAALTALVGTIEEGFQWLLPKRYWDLADIGLNTSAALLTLLLIWKGLRPRLEPGISPRSLQLTARLLLVEIVLLLLCFANTPERIDAYAPRVPGLAYLARGGPGPLMIEYGHSFTEPDIGRFQSRMTLEELRRIDEERAIELGPHLARFLDTTTTKYGGLQLRYKPAKHPFVFEGGGHLFYRQRLWERVAETDDPDEKRRLATQAWRENLILERYFPKVLAAAGAELSPEARQSMLALHDADMAYESEVSDWLFTYLSEGSLRFVLIVLGVALVILERLCSARLRDS